MPPYAIGTRFASVTSKWAYTGLDHILPCYMHPLYQSRRLQIWLLGTCYLLGPQGYVQERSENFRFSRVTSMQVSMGWFIADCHQEISWTLIHLLVTYSYAVDKRHPDICQALRRNLELHDIFKMAIFHLKCQGIFKTLNNVFFF